jgi:Na+/H+ antiporter NhaD/arsenite permease-like protein
MEALTRLFPLSSAILQQHHQALEGFKGYFAGLGPGGIALLSAPFVLLLLSLATLPLIAPHFWEKNRNKAIVALGFGAPVAAFVLYKDPETLANTVLDYGAFIALLGALFIIAGGIYVRGSFTGHPRVNTLFLLAGALLANVIGTTGASVLLVRPLIRANRSRRHKAHIFIFFIFIVSNCAGLLTPLGDPPLFLGFLRGVSFGWTLRLWPQWLVVVGALLALFYLIDRRQSRRQSRNEAHAHEGAGAAVGAGPEERVLQRAEERSAFEESTPERLGLQGAHNLIFLALVVGLIIVSGYALHPLDGPELLGEPFGAVVSKVVQMLGMALIALVSYGVTHHGVRLRNTFTFAPIVEVATLFAGIFAAMMPVLLILETQGGKLGVDRAWHFFWMTGALSGFLDNAPTYLSFTSLAKGVLALPADGGLAALAQSSTGALYLAAVSTGAVFMGAMTYIGNGPNFMVKAIVEEAGIKMPSFFGYMAWSGAILLPLFLLVTVLFFRG